MMLRVSFEDDVFVVRGHGNPTELGFMWDGVKRRHYTQSPKVAARLRDYCETSAKKQLARMFITFSPWHGPLSYPKGLKPYGFQRSAALFALSRNRSYLALDPGLGKTIIAAIAINTLDVPAVYICPPSLAETVQGELRKWLVGDKTVGIFEGETCEQSLPWVLIVRDSILHREDTGSVIRDRTHFARILGYESLFIVDEAHRYKSTGARRTRALLGDAASRLPGRSSHGLARCFDRHVYLSGTPMPNRPIELYSILSRAAPDTIGFKNQTQFGLRYCDGKLVGEECPRCKGKGNNLTQNGMRFCYYCKGRGRFDHGYDFSGASNLSELRKNVHGKFMLRLTKKAVLPELPPKVEEMVLLGKNPPKLVKAEKELRALSPKDLMEATFGSPCVATYCRLLGELKVKPASDYIKTCLEDTEESLLVFAFHKKVIFELEKKLAKWKPIVVTGDTPKESRHESVRLFQEKRERRLFVGNYLACGVGFTLTKATRVIFVEQSWTPADNDQASDRAHRIGQRDSVLVQYLVYENSIDRTRVETNLRKRKTINAFLT